MLNNAVIDPVIERALAEDFLDSGDLTTDTTVDRALTGSADFIVKKAGVIAGLPLAARVFQLIDPALIFTAAAAEGGRAQAGDVIASVSGRLASILKAERTALNFLQRLSGIATLTAAFTGAVAGTGAEILDTRKTTPGLRALEKYAVRQGGGSNHRMGLYDMIMIKDNHIDAAGGLEKAVRLCLAALRRRGLDIPVEVETRTLAEVGTAAALPVQRLMLDNMTCTQMRQAVRLVNGRVRTEASGNITLANVREVAETGVDYISVGALTHSAAALDISLRISRKKAD